jgi:DNA repair protein RecO (recombination protein O)
VIADTEAVVLRRRNFRDSSRILVLYTRTHGKLSAIAKGVKVSAARHGLSLEPMSHIRAVLYVKEQRDLQLLSRFEPLAPLGRLLDDMDRMAAGLAVVELMDAVTPQAEASEPVFRLLVETLEAIKNATNQPGIALYHFEVHLLGELGFRPNFDACSSCGRPLDDAGTADRGTLRMGHAGVVCPRCSDRGGLFSVSREALRALRVLQRTATAEEAAMRLEGGNSWEEIDAALRRCLQMNIDTLGRLKARDVFHALSKAPAMPGTGGGRAAGMDTGNSNEE